MCYPSCTKKINFLRAIKVDTHAWTFSIKCYCMMIALFATVVVSTSFGNKDIDLIGINAQIHQNQ